MNSEDHNRKVSCDIARTAFKGCESSTGTRSALRSRTAVVRDGLSPDLPRRFALQSGLKTYQECIALIESDRQLRNEFEGAIRITT